MHLKEIGNQTYSVRRLTKDNATKYLEDLFTPKQAARAVEIMPTRAVAMTAQMTQSTLIPASYRRHTLGDEYAGIDPSRSRNDNKTARNREPYLRWGFNNKYPFFLQDLYTKSALHRRCHESATNYSYGKGWVPMNEQSSDFAVWAEERGLTEDFTLKALQQIGAYGGAFVLMSIPDQLPENNLRDTNPRRTVTEMKVMKSERWRVGKPEDDGALFGESLYYWFHPEYNDTSRKTVDLTKLKGVPAFKDLASIDQEDWPNYMVQSDKTTPYYNEEENEDVKAEWNEDKYMDLICKPNILSNIYPAATYESDVMFDSIMVDASLSSFDVAGLQNGLTVGYVVTMPVSGLERLKQENPDGYERLKEEIKHKVHSELEGAENNNAALVVLQDVSEVNTEPLPLTITEIPNTNIPGIHRVVENRKARNIMAGWGVTDARLVGGTNITPQGFTDQAGLLNVAENIWYFNTLKPSLIRPLQNWVNTKLLSLYANEFNLAYEDLKIDGVGLMLQQEKNFIPKPDSKILQANFTSNEIRGMFNHPELTEEQRAEIAEKLTNPSTFNPFTIKPPEGEAGGGGDGNANLEAEVAQLRDNMATMFDMLSRVETILEDIPFTLNKNK